jgi:hypothetical protein
METRRCYETLLNNSDLKFCNIIRLSWGFYTSNCHIKRICFNSWKFYVFPRVYWYYGCHGYFFLTRCYGQHKVGNWRRNKIWKPFTLWLPWQFRVSKTIMLMTHFLIDLPVIFSLIVMIMMLIKLKSPGKLCIFVSELLVVKHF